MKPVIGARLANYQYTYVHVFTGRHVWLYCCVHCWRVLEPMLQYVMLQYMYVGDCFSPYASEFEMPPPL